MKQVNQPASVQDAQRDDDFEAQIAALDGAPTGAPLQSKDCVFLIATGIILPVALLLWGWS
ncbi:MAG: hypothetical protein RIB45_15220 [Marivibrio sp.]|uniref:hypothetical protein n=1 Tax=Marivibrio sp. TaxID=2039719 RepID=UPI0032ED9298